MNRKLDAFRRFLSGKRVALVGVGISNRAAVDFLLSCGASLTARDRNEQPDEQTISFFRSRGIPLFLGEQYLSDMDEDVIFRSPGIRPDVPQIVQAERRGACVTSEMEVFCKLCPCKIFAVTGSDGKTTTTTLIAKMLEVHAKKNGNRIFLGGNIGTPLLPQIEQITSDDIVVLELSSFQLHTMTSFSPTVAVVTNMTPNHLNWHLSMEEYIDSKKNIFRCQTKQARLVLNAENEITRSMMDESVSCVTRFSSKRSIKESVSCYYEKDRIYYFDGEAHFVMDRSDIKLVGLHNVENYLAAVSAVYGYVDRSDILEVARTFSGVPHRMELVCEKNGVRYYNSSIDTSPTRSLAALSCFENQIIVIVGGYDKHIPLEPLIKPLAQKAKFVVGTGDTGGQVTDALLAIGYSPHDLIYIRGFDAAVLYAASQAQRGDVVLLSPAAASFDAFPNFERRGERFRELVNNL